MLSTDMAVATDQRHHVVIGDTPRYPEQCTSTSPFSLLARNGTRHLPTVAGEQPTSAATTRFDLPSAQASTIFDRSARLCGLLGGATNAPGSHVLPRSVPVRPSVGQFKPSAPPSSHGKNAPRGSLIPRRHNFLSDLRIRTLGACSRPIMVSMFPSRNGYPLPTRARGTGSGGK